MAKFLLKASLIPDMERSKVVDPVTGKITLRINCTNKKVTSFTTIEFQFYPTDVLEITNPFGIEVMANKTSPKIKVNGAWFIADPAIKWFDQVDESTPSTLVIEQDGTVIMSKKNRRLMREYSRDTGVPVPIPAEVNPTTEAILALAKEHKREKELAK